jgi:hypothetical protein
MRKASVFVLLSILAIAGISPSVAATKASTVTAAFKTLLNTIGDSLDALDQKYEAEVDALDTALSSASIAANLIYDQEIQSASNLYAPQISASNQKVTDAKTKFQSVSSVKVLALGNNRNLWGNLNCPIARPDCRDSSDKGERFIVGEVTTVKQWIAEQPAASGWLTSVESMLGLGLIELVNRVDYLALTSTLKNEPMSLSKITEQYSAVQNAAKNKRDRAVQNATTARETALAGLDDAYETAKTQLEASETVASLALLASKRAAKDASNFDAAFAVAYKFEYNRQMVGEIADAAWTGDWTFRTIDSIFKVNKLAVSGDAIAARYSMKAARAYNGSIGNAFTNETDFRTALKVVSAIYKQTTKTTLNF